jgi:hypothetical protein
MTVEAYPLAWPEGWERKENNDYRKVAQFTVSMARARDELIAEIHRLCSLYRDPLIVLSTNVALRLDGLPYASQKAPEDPGAAVYFRYLGSQRVFACDIFTKVEHNIRAIGKTVEAIRGIERWGASDMLERAFTGFEALPAPDSWRKILKVSPDAPWGTIHNMYLSLRSQYHPDRGGDPDEFDHIMKAYQQAKREMHP